MGAVLRAADAGDAAALEAALAAGGYRAAEFIRGEEADVLRSSLSISVHSFPQQDTALGCASYRGHLEAVRILLAAGAE